MRKKVLGLVIMMAMAVPLWAAELVTPETQIKNITNEVLAIIRDDSQRIKAGDIGPATESIDAKVLQPHFNFRHMTSLGMGKEWRKASPEQQDTLVREFKTLLVRTYSNALTIYTDPTVSYKTARYQATDPEVMVRTQVLQDGIKPVDIDYNLEKIDNEWKVFDVVVAGVSLVTNYRQFFAQEVRNSGIDGVIKALQTKNQTLQKK